MVYIMEERISLLLGFRETRGRKTHKILTILIFPLLEKSDHNINGPTRTCSVERSLSQLKFVSIENIQKNETESQEFMIAPRLRSSRTILRLP
jgi:hypothetical protein